jgi:hypothetical protein
MAEQALRMTQYRNAVVVDRVEYEPLELELDGQSFKVTLDWLTVVRARAGEG